jgi:hypothetical protein
VKEKVFFHYVQEKSSTFLTVSEIIRSKVKEKVFFHNVEERSSSVSGAKKTTSGRRYGLWDFTILFLAELGTCVQNIAFTKVVEGFQKNVFCNGIC